MNSDRETEKEGEREHLFAAMPEQRGKKEKLVRQRIRTLARRRILIATPDAFSAQDNWGVGERVVAATWPAYGFAVAWPIFAEAEVLTRFSAAEKWQ